MTFVDIFTHVVNYMPSFNTQQAAGNLPQGIKVYLDKIYVKKFTLITPHRSLPAQG